MGWSAQTFFLFGKRSPSSGRFFVGLLPNIRDLRLWRRKINEAVPYLTLILLPAIG
jgi:hypothetical protein